MYGRLGPPAASLAALALCCACTRAAAPARSAQNAFAAGAVGDLVRQPSPGAEGCHLDGNYVTLDHEDADAPAVVLIESYVGADWGGRFVAWADGAALFDPVVDAPTDTRTTTLAPAGVERLRAAVAAQLLGHEGTTTEAGCVRSCTRRSHGSSSSTPATLARTPSATSRGASRTSRRDRRNPREPSGSRSERRDLAR